MRIVGDGRILTERDGTNCGIVFDHGSRNANRRPGGHHAPAHGFARRRLQRLPFLPALDRQNLRADAFRSHRGENAVLQVHWRLSFLIEWVHGHDTGLAAIANENSRHRMIDGARRMNAARAPSRTDKISRVSVEKRRGIKPAAAGGIEEPSSVMIGSPTPWLVADPSRAKAGIHNPLPISERRPAKPRAERPPAVSISAAA